MSVLTLAAGDDVSGYAEATSWRAAEIDPATVAQEAADKAARTKDAGQIEPATFRAVLEPYAVSELLFYFGFTSLNALALLEGRSYLPDASTRSSSATGSRSGTTGSTHAAIRRPSTSRASKRRVMMVEEGVARDVVWDRRTAKQAGRESTGHKLSAPAQSFGPVPFSLSLAGGDGLSGRARRARRRRHLHHAPALSRHRRPARRDHHGHDPRRDAPHRGRQGDDAARSTSTSRLRSPRSPPVSSGSPRRCRS